MIRYALGFDLAFAEPTTECRDELLFHIVDWLVPFTDSYQRRAIVPRNVPLECRVATLPVPAAQP